MDINKFFQSKIFKGAILGIAALIVLLIVFKVGTFIGFKKANFSYKWGENYHQNFAGPRGGFLNDFEGKDFINAHGIIGQIIKIDQATSSEQTTSLVIEGQDNVEKIILIKNDTAIVRLRDTLKATDFKIDDLIVVIGEPNDSGQIEAKLIRVLPPPPPANRISPQPPVQ